MESFEHIKMEEFIEYINNALNICDNELQKENLINVKTIVTNNEEFFKVFTIHNTTGALFDTPDLKNIVLYTFREESYYSSHWGQSYIYTYIILCKYTEKRDKYGRKIYISINNEYFVVDRRYGSPERFGELIFKKPEF